MLVTSGGGGVGAGSAVKRYGYQDRSHSRTRNVILVQEEKGRSEIVNENRRRW